MDNFMNNLVNLYELLNIGISIEGTVEYIFNSFGGYIPYNRIGIAMLDINGKVYSQAVQSDYVPLLKEGYSVDLPYTSLRALIKNREIRILNDYVEHLKQSPNSEPTKLIVDEGIRASIACPLVTNNICIGVILFSSKQKNIYDENHASMAKLIANFMAISIEKNLLVDDLILASITGFARLVEAKDSDTGLHLERMQSYSKIVAESLGKKNKYKNIVTDQYVKDIFKFSPLHDIGKVGIADGILLKPAKLTHEEFEVMKTHTIIGADVLKKASNNLLRSNRHFFDMGIEIVIGHHEKYNGKGYPHGISGDEIPISARIVAAADVLDALTSKRVYKNAIDLESSLQIIAEDSGKSFDPDVVEALFDSKTQVVDIYEKHRENIDLERR